MTSAIQEEETRQRLDATSKGSESVFRRLLRGDKYPIPALGILVVIALVMLVINPQFLSPGNLSAIAQQAAVPVVVAIGLTFVVLMGGIDLSVEGVMAAASLAVALLVANSQSSFDLGLLGVLLAIALGAGLGLIAGASVAWLRIPSFIVTIGTWQIGLGLGQMMFGSAPPQVEDQFLRDLIRVPVLGVPGLVWIAIAIVVIGLLLQRMTRFGRYAYVIGDSEEIAMQSGVNVRLFRMMAFVLAGGCAALAAVMATGRGGVGDVSIGSGLLFTTIAGVVLGGTYLTGGRGGVLHSVAGVLVIVSISNAMVLGGVNPYVQQAVQGIVVVGAAVATLWHSRARLRVVK
ncbi:ABC transporter permease [Leucobacter tenebrionis]|uniref:ABC transporter permease n=1 Tax=Leucobacter tenebrionis TaxID=2873270 RepID=UPI001CA69ABE|nr:ABC transporter permease [Leucobacter tenebrionis]QZY50918.1 ABC transporter permease [Leucobacter tenebrionis]